MSENAAKQSAGIGGAAAPQGSGTARSATPHGVPEPHFPSRSAKVLARVPDLESADSEVADQTGAEGRDARMLSSRLSTMILVGGGGLLLLAAVGLPLLLQSVEPSDATQEDQAPTWPLQPPAPTASIAPAWDGGSEQESTWQLPAGTAAQPASDMPDTSAWNDGPQTANWGAPSASDSWESPSPGQPWLSPSGAQRWDNHPAAPVSDAPQMPAFPGGTAAGVPHADQSDWSLQVERTPQVDQEAADSWQGQPRAPSWAVPPYGAAGQGQAPLAAPDGLIPSPSAAANPGPWAPTSDLNRTAGLAVPNMPTAHGSGLQAAYPSPTSYPGATYPVAGQSAANDATAEAPSAVRPISGYRPTDSSYEATTAWRYGARPDARYRQPGVARLQGAIEKPTESNAYEQHRSSLY
jgi:hypothetical protein